MSGEGSYALLDAAERRRHQRIYVALVSPRRFRVNLTGVAGGDDLAVYEEEARAIVTGNSFI